MREMDGDAIEIVCPERARLAAFLPVRPEHEVIDNELRAPVEQPGERELAAWPLEPIGLLHPLPRHRHAPLRQLIALPCELLLRRQQLQPRLQPVFVRY